MNALFDPQIISSLTLKKAVNIGVVSLAAFFSRIFRTHLLWGQPYILTAEPTNFCNLTCPLCETGAGKLNRPQQKLDFDIFKQVVDELQDALCYLILYNQGEPFLHDRLIDFLAYARSKKIYVITSTNGHFLIEDDAAERLVQSELNALIVSLDGANESTYQKYRNGGDFKGVLEGIQKLVDLKRQLKKSKPKIFIQFLVMKHNEHQIPEMQRLAARLSVDRLLLKTVQIIDAADASCFLPEDSKHSRYILEQHNLSLKYANHKPCSRLWTSSVMLSDGTIVPCCFDKNGMYAMGVISAHQSFGQIWRSKKYEHYRYCSLRKNSAAVRKTIAFCANCTQGQKVYL